MSFRLTLSLAIILGAILLLNLYRKKQYCKKACFPNNSMFLDGGKFGDDVCNCQINDEWRFKKKY